LLLIFVVSTSASDCLERLVPPQNDLQSVGLDIKLLIGLPASVYTVHALGAVNVKFQLL